MSNEYGRKEAGLGGRCLGSVLDLGKVIQPLQTDPDLLCQLKGLTNPYVKCIRSQTLLHSSTH